METATKPTTQLTRRQLRAKLRTARWRETHPKPPDKAPTPAAYSDALTTHFSVSANPDGFLISGRDLVATLPPGVVTSPQNNIFCAIPANPCYWRGTRVSALAAAHQCYRPLEMKFYYVPQVAVTVPGTVVVGTVWNTPTATESLEQSLVTSNGGAMSQCYTPFCTGIRLGSNLPQNLFTCAGPLDEDHNPFFFLALMRGSDVVPGYFFVEYSFELKNPLGQAVAYDCLATTAPEYGAVRISRSILTLATIPGFAGPGVVCDLEANGDVLYQGTVIDIPIGTRVMVYASNPITVIDPTFTSEVTSIIVLPNQATVGSSIVLQPDRATWNWANDSNVALGTFKSGGTTPLGFKSTLSSISLWLDTAVTGMKLFIYSLDLVTNTIGALIGVFAAVAGSQSNPTVVLSTAQRFSPSPAKPVKVKSRKRKEMLPETDSDASS